MRGISGQLELLHAAQWSSGDSLVGSLVVSALSTDSCAHTMDYGGTLANTDRQKADHTSDGNDARTLALLRKQSVDLKNAACRCGAC